MSGSNDNDNGVERLLEALQRSSAIGGGRGRRSPLYRWLRARHDQLLPVLDVHAGGAPNWIVVAEVLRGEGVTDGSGKAPSSERVRKTWWMLRKDLKAFASGKTQRLPVAVKPPRDNSDVVQLLPRLPEAAPLPPAPSQQTAGGSATSPVAKTGALAGLIADFKARRAAGDHQMPQPVMPSPPEALSQKAVDERIAEVKAQMAARGQQMPQKVE